jgi:hypothetical protein
LGNFMRTVAPPRAMAHRSLTMLPTKVAKIGARTVRNGCYVTFPLAQVVESTQMLRQILARITQLRAPPVLA